MATTRFTMRVLATLSLWAGFGLTASAQLPPLTADKALEIKPRHAVAIPTADPAKCRVDPIPNPKAAGTTMGYVVRDASGKPVRQFVSYDNKSFNIVSFYADGQEVYREVTPPDAGQPNQYRWLNGAGGKWGLDRNRDGIIDEWAVISPEEVGQELVQALISRDPKRIESLLVTKENLDALGIPAADQGAILDRARNAAQKLARAAEELKLSPEARWDHMQSGPPSTVPADLFGGRDDKVTHRTCTILIADGKEMKPVQAGELILVGRAWKVIDGPTVGFATPDLPDNRSAGRGPIVTPEIEALVKELDKTDQGATTTTSPEQLSAYYGKRVAILEQIVQKVPQDQQTEWVRLLIDSLGSAAEVGKADAPAMARLRQLKDVLTKTPTNPLAAYSSFRLLMAESRVALRDATPKDLGPLQDKYRTSLEEFIKAYPGSEDAGEAVLQLAMAYDYLNSKEGDEKAKTWYDYLITKHPQHPSAAKAAGAKRRLECEGKPLELQGATLGAGQAFSAGQLAGKVVVVYYWASWSTTLADDVKKLKDLVTTYGPKGLEVVTVCLDDDPAVASKAVRDVQIPGTHLHARGGVEANPLAISYGILVPPHVLVAGKDGKVISKNAQVMTLEEDLKKLMP